MEKLTRSPNAKGPGDPPEERPPRNIFDGWTEQINGPRSRNGVGGFCAAGWVGYAAKDMLCFRAMERLVIQALQQVLSPNRRAAFEAFEANHGLGDGPSRDRLVMLFFNDVLGWSPDQFRALQIEVPGEWFDPAPVP